MEQSGAKVEEGTLRQTYSDAALRKAMRKYSFEFEIDGKCCSAWCNPQDGGFYSDCPASQRESLFGAVAELERIIAQPKPRLDSLTVRKFLCEHLQAMIEVETELQESPASESQYEFLNPKPVERGEIIPGGGVAV